MELEHKDLKFVTYHLKESIIENLKWLKNHNELCDVILISGNHKVSAHSCVLGSHSPILAAILQARLAVNNEWSILNPLIISIEEDNIDAGHLSSTTENCDELSILNLLISFIYGEEIMIEQTRLQDLINFSKLLGLSQHFTNRMEPEISKAQKCSSAPKKSRRKPSEQNSKALLKSDGPSMNPIKSFSKPNHPKARRRDTMFCSGKDVKVNSFGRISRKKKLSAKMRMKFRSSFKTFFKKTSPAMMDDPSYVQGGEKLDGKLSTSDTVDNPTKTPAEPSVWLKDEPQSDSELKVENIDERFTNAEIIVCEDIKGHFVAQGTNDPLNSKTCPTNTLKRVTRVATTCYACKASFHRVSDLIKHVKEKLHYSQICPLCFSQLSDFEEQKDHFGQHDNPLPFFCHCCDSRFRSRAGLAMHAPKHSDTKPYSCEECGRAFKWRHSAQAHSITHRKHCHLLCDVCGFSSKYASTFKSHLKRHYDQFLPCPHPGCQFKSFRKTHLNDHIASHAKLRSHQCEVCGHSFSQAKNLRRHMRLHTPDNCFLKCALYSGQGCPYKTTRPDKLRLHLIQKHNLEHQDRIPLPTITSADLSLEEEDGPHPSAPTPEPTGAREVSENIPPFKNLQLQPPQFEIKEKIFPRFGPGKENENEVKSAEINVLSSEITDILLDDQNSLIPHGERPSSDGICIPDSYEPYDNIQFHNQPIEEGTSTLVLMGNIEVLENLSSEENINSEIPDSAFEPQKTAITSSKLDHMMDTLPVILHTDKNLSYLHSNHLALNEIDRTSHFADNNDEYLSRECNLTLEDSHPTLHFIKLSDNSIAFLSHDQEEVTLSIENCSSTLHSEDNELKSSDGFKLDNDDSELKSTVGFKSFASNQFSLF